VYPDNSGTLSWEGSAGQLMSVTNTLTGTIFAVNDVSGIPSITVQDTGQVTLAPYTGNLVIGNVTDANTAKVQITGTVSATGNVTAPFFIGNGSALTGISASGGSSIINGTSNVVVAASGNVTVGVAGTAAVATFASTGLFVPGLASVTGNVQGGNLRTAGSISATGAVTGAAITGTSLTVSTGNITGGNLILSGAISDAGQLDITTTASNGNIVLTPNGTGVIVAAKDIRNGQANGVGNIGTTGGFFNTIFAKATSAQYADVAEKYLADTQYAPGTVLEIGGSAEVTATTGYASTRIAGVVSTNPAFIMNSSETSENSVELALLGRIPCRVVGKIERGDMLCSSRIAGVATALNENLYKPGAVIGKALESYNSVSEGVIEILVGRL
jgi:hypothetical protein